MPVLEIQVTIRRIKTGIAVNNRRKRACIVINLDPTAGVTKEDLLPACVTHYNVKLFSRNIAVSNNIRVYAVIHMAPTGLTVHYYYADCKSDNNHNYCRYH